MHGINMPMFHTINILHVYHVGVNLKGSIFLYLLFLMLHRNGAKLLEVTLVHYLRRKISALSIVLFFAFNIDIHTMWAQQPVTSQDTRICIMGHDFVMMGADSYHIDIFQY